MRISKVFNGSLLQCIAEEGTITIEALKKKYLPPEHPRVIQSRTVMFDSDLKVLEEEGYITIEDDIVQFIHG